MLSYRCVIFASREMSVSRCNFCVLSFFTVSVTVSFIHSFSKYLLSYFVQSNVPGTMGNMNTESNRNPTLGSSQTRKPAFLKELKCKLMQSDKYHKVMKIQEEEVITFTGETRENMAFEFGFKGINRMMESPYDLGTHPENSNKRHTHPSVHSSTVSRS